MMRIDHHLHTERYSPDSSIDPEELIRHAKEIGLDAVVITEHDRLWPESELAELNRPGGPLVLAGVEISALEGHFLVYGLPTLDETPPGVALPDLLRVVRSHGAAIVAAHPFRWGQDFDEIVQTHGPAFDALELVSKNVTPVTRRRTELLLARSPMGTTGSSDAHEIDQLGCYHSTFPGPIRSLADFIAALRAGQSRPSAMLGSALACGPVA
jgi:predicted metal-dependent phosphoesterase TrpH